MKKRILAALLAASMALCAGCGSQSDDTAEDDQTPSGTAVEVTEVTQGAMSTEYSVNGKVAADNEVQVFPMLAGQVLTLSVSEGDKVSKGQTLLSVDTSTVTSTMSSLRESYNATKTATDKAIENAQISVQQAQLAVENTEALLEAGAAAEQDLTKAKQGLEQAQAGDTIITLEVSRLARSTKQLCEIIEAISKKHLCLVIVSSITMDCRSGHADPMTEAFLQMAGVFSQLELAMIRARVRSGMANARAKGKQIGRPHLTADDIPASFLRHYPAYKGRQLNISEFARVCNLSRTTVYKYIDLLENG